MRITLNNVEYTRGNAKLLNNIGCSFSTGFTYVVGKNGAGKSSLLKLIATAVYPDKGEAVYSKLIREDGVGIYRKQLSTDEIRTMIGYMPQQFTGHPEMTIERYLKYIAFHKGIPHRFVKTTLDKWLNETNLLDIKRRKLGTLSGGQLQKIGLIQALINHPRICILDEPFEGLDIGERLYFQRVIQRLSFHSVVIVSTHLIEEIDRSNEAELLYLKDGNVSFFGEISDIDLVSRGLEV